MRFPTKTSSYVRLNDVPGQLRPRNEHLRRRREQVLFQALLLACSGGWACQGCGSDRTAARSGSVPTEAPSAEHQNTAGSTERNADTGPGFGVGDGLIPTAEDPWVPPPDGPADVGPHDGESCASAEVDIERVVPTVWLMIDGSGSMGTPLLGGGTRWSVLREALLDPAAGLVTNLQQSVAFGLYVYDGGLLPPNPLQSADCPRVVSVDPALNNYDSLVAAYPLFQTGSSTTTHWALVELQKRIAAQPQPQFNGPTYVVLATDGQPNICDFHDGIPSNPLLRDQAVQTVRELAMAGTRSFVISVAADEPGLAAHLQEVATAGSTGKSAFTPETKADLVEALSEAIGEAVSCDIRIQGEVAPGLECSGTVTLNGTALECGSPDGYRIKEDYQTVELQGAACQQLRTNSDVVLHATFPCGAVELQ